MHTRTYTHACVHMYTYRPYLQLGVKIGLELSKMASNATLSHLKLKFSLGGACPQTPLVSLHSIYISAYTSIITALHVFYRCLGYHLYIHACACPPTILCNYPPPPPHHPACYIHNYNTCINLSVYLAW